MKKSIVLVLAMLAGCVSQGAYAMKKDVDSLKLEVSNQSPNRLYIFKNVDVVPGRILYESYQVRPEQDKRIELGGRGSVTWFTAGGKVYNVSVIISLKHSRVELATDSGVVARLENVHKAHLIVSPNGEMQLIEGNK